MIHEQGCPHDGYSIHRAYRGGCQCPGLLPALVRYRTAAKARWRARTGTRRGSDVDLMDVEAAIISYASRRVPVPASMTKAEKRLVADWMDRRGDAPSTIAAVTGVVPQSELDRRLRKAAEARAAAKEAALEAEARKAAADESGAA